MFKKITILTILFVCTKQAAAPLPNSLYSISPEIALETLVRNKMIEFYTIIEHIYNPNSTAKLNEIYPNLQFALGKGKLSYSQKYRNNTYRMTVIEQIIGNWLLYRNTYVNPLNAAEEMAKPHIMDIQPEHEENTRKLKKILTSMFNQTQLKRLLPLTGDYTAAPLIGNGQMIYLIKMQILRTLLNITPQINKQERPYAPISDSMDTSVIKKVIEKFFKQNMQ